MLSGSPPEGSWQCGRQPGNRRSSKWSQLGPLLLELRFMAFPANRLRRLRRTETLRALVRETRLTPESLVYPLFVCLGTGIRNEVHSMPGVFNLSIDEAVKEVREAQSLGVSSIILFGLPATKDEVATSAWVEDGIVQKAACAIKSEVRDVVVMGDVCLCEYMTHGHCGIVRANDKVTDKVNNKSAPPLPGAAAEYRDRERREPGVAGTHCGFAGTRGGGHRRPVRHDGWARRRNSRAHSTAPASTILLSFPTRRNSLPVSMDRSARRRIPRLNSATAAPTRWIPANIREAMREIELDIEEGADMIMVKPAMPYLDVIAAAHDRFDLPLAAYQVSGEYAMIEAAARNHWIERERVIMESLVCIRRAGASIILTYYAKEAAKLLA